MNRTQDKPDSLTLASYLDGRLDAEGCKAVERWLAESPDGIDLLRSVRRTLSTPSPMAPDRLVSKAAALVPDPVESPELLTQGRFWHVFYWPSTAALVLVSCLVGFQLAQSAMTEAGLVDPAGLEIRSTAGAVFDLADLGGSPL